MGFQKIIDETVAKGTEEDEQSKIENLHETLVLMKQLVAKSNPQSSKQISQFSDVLSQMRFDTTIEGALYTDGDDKLYFNYFTGAIAVFQEPDLLKYYENLRRMIVEGNKSTKPARCIFVHSLGTRLCQIRKL